MVQTTPRYRKQFEDEDNPYIIGGEDPNAYAAMRADDEGGGMGSGGGAPEPMPPPEEPSDAISPPRPPAGPIPISRRAPD